MYILVPDPFPLSCFFSFVSAHVFLYAVETGCKTFLLYQVVQCQGGIGLVSRYNSQLQPLSSDVPKGYADYFTSRR